MEALSTKQRKEFNRLVAEAKALQADAQPLVRTTAVAQCNAPPDRRQRRTPLTATGVSPIARTRCVAHPLMPFPTGRPHPVQKRPGART